MVREALSISRMRSQDHLRPHETEAFLLGLGCHTEHGSGDEAGQEEDEEEVSALLGRELQHVKVFILHDPRVSVFLPVHFCEPNM